MNRPDPRAIDRAIASDPKIVGLLADYIHGVQRAGEPRVTPRATPKPIVKPKSPEKRDPVFKPRKTRKVSAPKPTRSGPTITATDDPVPSELIHMGRTLGRDMDRGALQPSRVKVGAHDTQEPTPCRVCGGLVAREGADRWGPWRQHRGCAALSSNPSRVAAAAVALGVVSELDHVAALLVSHRVGTYADSHSSPLFEAADKKRKAWLHVDRKALLKAVSDAMTEQAEAEIPRACILGRCAWCGVLEAIEWHESSYRWQDGAGAPLCGDCGPIYIRRGEPSPRYMDDARSALAEAMTGVPGSLGVPGPAAVLAYVEAEGQGTGEDSWDFLPFEAVEAFRWAEWARYGGRYAPADHRAEALARAARPSTPVVEPDPFGFRGEEAPSE